MRRVGVLGFLVMVGAMGMAVGAYQQPASDARIVKVNKLKDNLFVLTEGGGNTAVFIQADGVTVVDTKNPGWGKPILDAIRGLTDKPVTTIVNTHTHGDHVSGNVEFPDTVEVVTHENTKANMERMMPPPGMGKPGAPPQNIFKANGGRGTPKKTFQDRLTLGSGADRVDLYYFGRGHTNGDTMVVFPAHRVMHMGDLFPGKSIPIMDSNNGGSGVHYPETLKKVHDGVPDVDGIITGHSGVMSRQDLREYSEFIGELVEAVRAGKKAGESAEQIAKKWTVPARFKGYAPPNADRLRLSVQLILDELP
jgi:glyoxylase-like metal-dependent hydrolase (beta-lactamase superfamily II)